jgi:ribonuclease P protein component
MLPKKNRADKKAIEKIFKEGLFVGSCNLSLKYIKSNTTTLPILSFIVPKNAEKRAVRRNYMRRCGYVAIRNYFSKLPRGFVGVFIFNKIKSSDILSKLIEDDLKILISKLNETKK